MKQPTFRTNDTTLCIPVGMLEFGMYVYRLDRPWNDTPFVMHGFLVLSDYELKTLKELCDTVFIDCAKSICLSEQPQQKARTRSQSDKFDIPPMIDRNLAKKSLASSLPVYRAALKEFKDCLSLFRKQTDLEPEKLEGLVDRCLDEIVKNSSAITWLSRIKSQKHYLIEHSMHVGLLAMIYAVHCGWTQAEARDAGVAGLLIDIGNLKVPKPILKKPSALFDAEVQWIHAHPKWSRYYLEKSGFNNSIVEAVYSHHERPDGQGFPNQQLGSQIPTLARLLHVVDAYDAMTSCRPYAERKTALDATAELYRGRGSQFDSEIVDNFIAMIGVFPIGTLVELNTGEVAVIIGVNNDAKLLPKVAVVRDKNKKPVPEALVNLRDLVDENGIPLVRIKTMLTDGSHGLYIQDYMRHLLNTD